MKISAICLTYRRPDLLEEALQSFLMQDYAGEKELIILNDEPEQPIHFNHPQVVVKNMTDRAPDLPTKYNYAASLATGQLITPWDDDDIFLPHRLTTIASRQNNGLWWTDHLYTDTPEGALRLTTGHIHCNHAYSAAMFIRFGAYHDRPDLSFDFNLINAIRSTYPPTAPDNIKPSYIYRKNSTTSQNHSALYRPDLQEQYKAHSDAHPHTPGDITLRPHWTRDWQSLATTALTQTPTPLHEADPNYKEQK